MQKQKKGGVSTQQAALIHELLGECFEVSLRQQLQSGDFNAAMLGKVLEWLKSNNINVVEEADERLSSLARVFRESQGDASSDLSSYLDGMMAREI